MYLVVYLISSLYIIYSLYYSLHCTDYTILIDPIIPSTHIWSLRKGQVSLDLICYLPLCWSFSSICVG